MALRMPWKRAAAPDEEYVPLPEDVQLMTLTVGEHTFPELSVIRTPDGVFNFMLAAGIQVGATASMVWTADGRGGEGDARVVRATEATIGQRATRISHGLQRRGSLRVPINVPVTLTGPDGATYTLNTRNLSVGGALAVGAGPQPGEALQGRIDLPGKLVIINAQVVPGYDPPGVLRLAFVGLTTQAEDLISDYVTGLQRKEAARR